MVMARISALRGASSARQAQVENSRKLLTVWQASDLCRLVVLPLCRFCQHISYTHFGEDELRIARIRLEFLS